MANIETRALADELPTVFMKAKSLIPVFRTSTTTQAPDGASLHEDIALLEIPESWPSAREPVEPSSEVRTEAIFHPLILLYASHFLSTWNSRGFEFGATLVLASVYPGNLLRLSIYAIARALSAMISLLGSAHTLTAPTG